MSEIKKLPFFIGDHFLFGESINYGSDVTKSLVDTNPEKKSGFVLNQFFSFVLNRVDCAKQ
jgi:hypothetical protein